MKRLAFKMKLHDGQVSEYKRRHDAIWPELRQLLKDTGISGYSIYLDEESLQLFGVMNIDAPEMLEKLPEHPVMKKWWNYMKDIMDTNPDGSPVAQMMNEVFYLP